MSSDSGGGIGIAGVLFVVFLVLKLCNVISWSWWWVTAPLWGSFVLWVAVLLIAFFASLAFSGVSKWPRR